MEKLGCQSGNKHCVIGFSHREPTKHLSCQKLLWEARSETHSLLSHWEGEERLKPFPWIVGEALACRDGMDGKKENQVTWCHCRCAQRSLSLRVDYWFVSQVWQCCTKALTIISHYILLWYLNTFNDIGDGPVSLMITIEFSDCSAMKSNKKSTVVSPKAKLGREKIIPSKINLHRLILQPFILLGTAGLCLHEG